MARASDKTGDVHYSIRASQGQMYEQGTGACCEAGLVTAYPGLVTCVECLEGLGVSKLVEEQ